MANNISLDDVVVIGNRDALGFRRTARIASFGLVPGTMHIDTEGTQFWPAIGDNPNDKDGQAGTLWLFVNIGGRWYGAGAERLRKYQLDGDKPEAGDGGKISDLVGGGWFTADKFPAPIAGYNPQPGEPVGLCIFSGDTRLGYVPTVSERTNLLVVAWPNDNGRNPLQVLWTEGDDATGGTQPMKLATTVKASIDRYISKFPIPTGPAGEAFEEQLRQYSIRLCEQARFDTNDATIGTKRADGGRPISKDTISKQSGGQLLTWDLFIGSGSGNPQRANDPDSMDTTGQVFVPVSPVNHVGGTGGQQPPVVVPPAGGGSGTDQGVANALQRLEQFVKTSDDNNERRYQDLANHAKNVATIVAGLPTEWRGEVKVPFIGTVSIRITPAPK